MLVQLRMRLVDDRAALMRRRTGEMRAVIDGVVLDGGDTMAADFAVWWGTNGGHPRPLWLSDTNYSPHSGNKCAVLKFAQEL